MACYLGLIEKLNNHECIIYIFTGKIQNGTPSIFDKSIYHCWYKESRNKFSPVMIDTTHNNVRLEKKTNRNIPRIGVIDQQTINIHE